MSAKFTRAYSARWSDPCPKCDTVSTIEAWGPDDVPSPTRCYECGEILPPPKPRGHIAVTGIDRDAGTITVEAPPPAASAPGSTRGDRT